MRSTPWRSECVRRSASPPDPESAPSKRESAPSQRESAPSQRECAPSQRESEPSQRGSEPSQRGRISRASWCRSGVRSCSPTTTCSPWTSKVYTNRSGWGGVGATERRSIRLSSDSTSGVRGSSPRVSSPLCRIPAKPPERVTATTGLGAPPLDEGDPPVEDVAAGLTPTASHAFVTASTASGETSFAAATVAAPKPAKSVSGPMPEVSAAYQILPAPSQELPPSATAARENALLGIPEFVWTPPLSSEVST